MVETCRWWHLFYCPFFQEQEECTDFLHHSRLEVIPVSKNRQRTVKYLQCNSKQKFRLATVMYCIAHYYYATVPATFPSEKAPGNHYTGSWDMDGWVMWNWIWEVGWEGMDGTHLPHDNYHPCRMRTCGVHLWEWSRKFYFQTLREISRLDEDQLASLGVYVGQLAMHGKSCIRGHRLKYERLEARWWLMTVNM